MSARTTPGRRFSIPARYIFIITWSGLRASAYVLNVAILYRPGSCSRNKATGATGLHLRSCSACQAHAGHWNRRRMYGCLITSVDDQ